MRTVEGENKWHCENSGNLFEIVRPAPSFVEESIPPNGPARHEAVEPAGWLNEPVAFGRIEPLQRTRWREHAAQRGNGAGHPGAVLSSYPQRLGLPRVLRGE